MSSEVIHKTLGEIRTFLDEILNGTSQYRSVHSLTEQVEHQYHSRFLIELIQNAHDALFALDKSNSTQRIEVELTNEENKYGTLYVANDGQPFTSSNFKALSNLGQSDKDPQKSIGNKGIGFRSVLEISKVPQIYSRKEITSSRFDGYCFGFTPDVIQMFECPISRMLKGENEVKSPISPEELLLDWDEVRYEKFRRRCQSFDAGWLQKELTFLSPYALPIPICSEDVPEKITNFEKRGFSSVIRLQLDNKSAYELASERLEEFGESSVIFLQRLDTLQIVNGDVGKRYHRKQSPRERDIEKGCEVCIVTENPGFGEDSDFPISRYWLWEKIVGGEKNPKERMEIKSVVMGLPGKWPKVEEATIAVAVKVGDDSVDGVLNIYLPTEVRSGCAAHFSAPFFGDMSRTNIDFEKPFNQLLIRAIAQKSADVILSSLAGKNQEEAAAIVDLLSPLDNERGTHWWDELTKAFSERNIEIENEEIALSDQGWNSLTHTRLLPKIDSAILIDAEMLRSEVTYPVFWESLSSRESRIQNIFEKVGINPYALPQDNAATVESIASKLNRNPELANWNGFWHDVEILLNRDTKSLIGRNVLLGSDNQLHACNDNFSVFFRPRVSGTDDEIIEQGGVKIDDIPKNLRSHIAFLHKDIQVHIPRTETRGGVQTTPVQKYLDSGLVETYGVERIFSSVLVKATPKLPCNLNGKHSNLCRDILQWSLKLLKGSKGNLDRSTHLLGQLLAPCIGGWYPIEETSFGPGWPGKRGEELEIYLRQADTPECDAAIDRLLLPPSDPSWGAKGGSEFIELLERAGVFSGIRLILVSSEEWSSKFLIPGWKAGVELPVKFPPGYSSIWPEYRNYIEKSVRPQYRGEFLYKFQDMYRIPGIEALDRFDSETLGLLTKILLDSIPRWKTRWKTWEQARLRKTEGESAWIRFDSPLFFLLREVDWMHDSIVDDTNRNRPSDCWYIPRLARVGGLHQFSHLRLIPHSIAEMLDMDPDRVCSLINLGMPNYDLEEEITNPRLLNDLVAALEDPSVEISNPSVFLGQVRDAWAQFHPNSNEDFPNRIIVQKGTGPLEAITPTEDNPVYIPDASIAVHKGLQLHSKSVVALETKDAKRLKEQFQDAYNHGINLASELTLVALVDGEQWQQQNKGTQLSEEFSWLIQVVLAVFAFSRGQSRGVGTKTFRNAVERLRETRVFWVDSLEVGLWSGETPVAKTSVPAFWQRKLKFILAEKNTRNTPSLLAETLESVIDRNDIAIDLKLVLENCEREDEISEEVICKSLEKLHISQDQYQEVRHQWWGDLAWRIDLVRPLILLLDSDADIEALDNVSTEMEFQEFLQTIDFFPLSDTEILAIVKDSTDSKSLGYAVWMELGEQAQLSQWNSVLLTLGRALVENVNANEQFQDHLISSHAKLRSVVRLAISKRPELGTFNALDDRLVNISCPAEYSKKFWEVEFQNVMKCVLDVLREWDVAHNVLTAVECAETADELHQEFEKLELNPDFDPIETHADNKRLFSEVLEKVRKMGIVWCLRKDTDAEIWGEDECLVESQLDEDLNKSAFLEIWNETKCFEILRKLKRSELQRELWDALDIVSSTNELMNKLDISQDELNKADAELEQRRQKRNLQRKTVKVCGVDFINTEGNLGDLWEHIHENVKDDEFIEVRLNCLEDLQDQSSSKSRRKTSPRPTIKTRPPARLNQSMKDLIGYAGEIYAYIAMKKIYGIKASNWISNYSRYKFPGNQTDDGFGCDFRFLKDGKTYYVEVKATQSENEVFELGSSEVELAIGTANRQKKEFIILHVINALSKAPRPRVLPNPYSKKHRNKYKFEEAGFRVRYKASNHLVGNY